MVRLLGDAVAAGLLGVAKQGQRGSGHFTIYRLAMPKAGKPPPMEVSTPTKTSTDGGFDRAEISMGDAGKPPSVSKKTSMGGDKPLKRNKPQRIEPLALVEDDQRTADADRESATTNSAPPDDAPSNQRTPDGALIRYRRSAKSTDT